MPIPNLTVFVVETDIFARYAISSYLGWDRRTRVTQKPANLSALDMQLRKTLLPAMPDAILLDDILLPSTAIATQTIKDIHKYCAAHVFVMAHQSDEVMARAVRAAGARGYVLREEVGLRVSWMVVWGQVQSFVVTPATAFFPDAVILPHSREYPELTDRIRQALMLCVVEGMSAELAADEMGLSPHTIRTYIKEGYSILEARDQTPYPAHLSPQEKAFMRLTALEIDQLDKKLRQDEEKDS